MDNKKIIRPIFFGNELNGNAKRSFHNLCNEVGQYYYTNSGARIQIVDYQNNKHVKYQFDNGHTGWAALRFIKKGMIGDPYFMNCYGGYFGSGPYNEDDKAYDAWNSIMTRCGDTRKVIMYGYEDVTVCEEWKCYQTFAEWYHAYLSKLNPNCPEAYHIDKDIFQWNQQNKIYSPNTCCLIPARLNKVLENLHGKPNRFGLPVGVNAAANGRYRASISIYENGIGRNYPLGVYNTVEEAFNAYAIAKKDRILKIAKDFYDMGYILPEVYMAIQNIEIKPNI